MNQFIVSQLTPEHRQGGGIYQLSEASVSPTRVVEINEDGFAIEETIPTAAKSARFVDRDGNICDVALRTGRVPSEDPEAQRYEQIVIHDQIRAGALPLDACPFTHAFAHIKGGPLVKPPAGAADCQGRPAGCEHMRAEIDKRRAASRKRHEQAQVQFRRMGEGDIREMVAGFAKVFGDTFAGVTSARATLGGPGEQDAPSTPAAPAPAGPPTRRRAEGH